MTPWRLARRERRGWAQPPELGAAAACSGKAELVRDATEERKRARFAWPVLESARNGTFPSVRFRVGSMRSACWSAKNRPAHDSGASGSTDSAIRAAASAFRCSASRHAPLKRFVRNRGRSHLEAPEQIASDALLARGPDSDPAVG